MERWEGQNGSEGQVVGGGGAGGQVCTPCLGGVDRGEERKGGLGCRGAREAMSVDGC